MFYDAYSLLDYNGEKKTRVLWHHDPRELDRNFIRLFGFPITLYITIIKYKSTEKQQLQISFIGLKLKSHHKIDFIKLIIENFYILSY